MVRNSIGKTVVPLFLLLTLPAVPQEEQVAAASSPGVRADRGAGKQEAAKAEEKDEALQRFRMATQVLGAATDIKELTAALDVLRDGFPESRAVLVESARKGSPRVRAFVIQVLGEEGDVETDLAVVAAALRDPNLRVRRAAVMAIRRLGKAGFQALADYLPRETSANNLKMAVKTLQMWRDEAAVPYLVRLLEKQEDRGLRNFIFNALESLSGRKLGRDVEAWKAYAQAWLELEQAKRLLGSNNSSREEKQP